MDIKITIPPRDFYFTRDLIPLDLPEQEKNTRRDFILAHEVAKLKSDEYFIRHVAERSMDINEVEFDFSDRGIVVIDSKNSRNRFNLQMSADLWDANERILQIAEYGIHGHPGANEKTVGGSAPSPCHSTDIPPQLHPNEETIFTLYPRESLAKSKDDEEPPPPDHKSSYSTPCREGLRYELTPLPHLTPSGHPSGLNFDENESEDSDKQWRDWQAERV